MPFEIANALSAMVKRKRLSREQALFALDQTDKISVRLVDVPLEASLKLAIDHNLYAYDAFFIQCAKSMACPLLTLEKRMQKAASSFRH